MPPRRRCRAEHDHAGPRPTTRTGGSAGSAVTRAASVTGSASRDRPHPPPRSSRRSGAQASGRATPSPGRGEGASRATRVRTGEHRTGMVPARAWDQGYVLPGVGVTSGTQLARDELAASLSGDGWHLPDDVLRVAIRVKGAGALLIGDTVALAGQPPGVYATPVGGSVTLAPAGRLHLTGDPRLLAGSVCPLRDAGDGLARRGVAPLDAAWARASTRPARFLGPASAAGRAGPRNRGSGRRRLGWVDARDPADLQGGPAGLRRCARRDHTRRGGTARLTAPLGSGESHPATATRRHPPTPPARHDRADPGGGRGPLAAGCGAWAWGPQPGTGWWERGGQGFAIASPLEGWRRWPAPDQDRPCG
jgi:hypothetical protein